MVLFYYYILVCTDLEGAAEALQQFEDVFVSDYFLAQLSDKQKQVRGEDVVESSILWSELAC